MKTVTLKNKDGFTIIEVVLVLAIAGLIFAMVFLALPALQRSMRDTERKKNIGELMTIILTYKSNNRGKIPSTGNGSWLKVSAGWNKSEYLSEYKYSNNSSKSNHIDDYTRTGDLTVVPRWENPVKSAQPGDWIIAKGVQCNLNSDGGYNFVAGAASSGSFAALVLLESFRPKTGWSYCVDLNSTQ